MVDAAGELVEADSVATKMIFEIRQVQAVEVANCSNTGSFHTILCDLTYARNAAHRKRKKKVLRFVRLNNEKAIWFAPV